MATGTEVRTFKAFRPSCFGDGDWWDGDEESSGQKQANMKTYARRANARLPLFKKDGASVEDTRGKPVRNEKVKQTRGRIFQLVDDPVALCVSAVRIRRSATRKKGKR